MNEDKTIPVKKYRLTGLAVFGHKEKKSTGEEVEIHFLNDDIGKSVVPLSHINIIGIEENRISRVKNHGREL